MAWETRHGRRYLYRSRRVAGRVRKLYFGRGAVAEAADQMERLERQARQDEAETLRGWQGRLDPLDRLVAELDANLRQLVAATLLIAGFWRSDYRWRRKRMVTQSTPPGSAAIGGDDVPTLLHRAHNGDGAALATLRVTLDATPGFWSETGDLARHAEHAWIGLIAGSDMIFREALSRRLAALKSELAGPAPTPLEMLLAERIGLAWLIAHYSDALFAQQAKGASVKLANHMLDRVERANRRLQNAIGALATLRKLIPNGGRSADGAADAVVTVPPAAAPGQDRVPARPPQTSEEAAASEAGPAVVAFAPLQERSGPDNRGGAPPKRRTGTPARS